VTEKTVSVSYTTRFLVNTPTGWRQKLAQALIGVAARLDRRRWMLAVEFCGTATVGRKVEREIVCRGLDMMQAAFNESVANETLECVMRDEYPYLYQNHVGDLKC